MDRAKEFERRVGRSIDSYKLLRRCVPVIIGLSGGADSVALLAVLTALGYDCRAAHCNFRLRGDESQRDMNFCRRLAAILDVDLFVREFDVKARMELTGESVEMACRSLRYSWFDSLIDSEGAQCVAVAHHREDRAETFMLNLMRGAGINGLTSMNRVNGSVVRPLLDFSREEIEQYLQDRGLEYVTDSTNATTIYRRNHIRNRVFPLLDECFPGAVDSVLKSMACLESAREIYREAVDLKLKKYISSDGKGIDLKALVLEPQAPTLLMEYLGNTSFSMSQISDILENVNASGLRFISSDGRVVAELSRGYMTLTDSAGLILRNDVIPFSVERGINEPLTIISTRLPVELFHPCDRGALTACFDAGQACLKSHSWEIRHWQRGDRIVPFGSVRSKLVSDLFVAAKYNAAQKREQWVVLCDSVVVWLPGLRNSSFAPVGPKTKYYLQLEYKP